MESTIIESTSVFTDDIITSIIQGISALILGLVTLGINMAINYFKAKFNLEISAKLESSINDTVYKGIMYAEQLAKSKTKDKVDKAIESSDKLKLAVEFIDRNLTADQKKLLGDNIQDRIECTLGEMKHVITPTNSK